VKIKVEEDSLLTSRTGVFAGGDVVTGTKFIVDAIANDYFETSIYHNNAAAKDLNGNMAYTKWTGSRIA